MKKEKKKEKKEKKNKKNSLQKDLFGQEVHILNVKKTYRMVKCGRCGDTVKSSNAKTHLSYGKVLTICNKCLKKDEENS